MKDLGFGKVKFEGKEYALKQETYIDGPIDKEPVFKATAVDIEGKEYEVEWEVKENWKEIAKNGDDSELVEDWERPTSITEI